MTATSATLGQPSHLDESRSVYLDCNATTPIEPRVLEEVVRYLRDDFGNAGSRTHLYGQAAKNRVNQAREQVAAVVDARPDEVLFTSGATESNNLAILGLADHGEKRGRRHLISTEIEHKAVLEPLDALVRQGFRVSRVPPTAGGWVDPSAIAEALSSDTLAVSVMAANNETGVIQPIDEIANLLADHEAFLHVDAAQTFGKVLEPMTNKRIDLISVSGHKIYGPKGVGALIVRRRGFDRTPLRPVMFGGGQERGLRPGTLPVALIAGLGMASSLACTEHGSRLAQWTRYKARVLATFAPFVPHINGDEDRTLPTTINLSLDGLDSEAVILALKDEIAISNGSACTSQSYEPSHVLTAMGLEPAIIQGALRISWSHLTPAADWEAVADRIRSLTS